MSLKSVLVAGFFLFAWAAQAVFAQTGPEDPKLEALMKKSNCFKCHSVTKKKDGPPYKEIAAKYKEKSEPEQKLYTHLTTNPKVKIDGKEEEHASLKTKNDDDVRKVVQWILSL
ncbi:MAG: c-type cytochrome [Betaproteobacteria bacterium]